MILTTVTTIATNHIFPIKKDFPVGKTVYVGNAVYKPVICEITHFCSEVLPFSAGFLVPIYA